MDIKKIFKPAVVLKYIVPVLLLILIVIFGVLNYDSYSKSIQENRNQSRIEAVEKISQEVKSYVETNNNLPTTNIPENSSILPILNFSDNTPLGGVNIDTLENFSFIETDEFKSFQQNANYFIGTVSGEIVIYTNDLEQIDGEGSKSYLQTISIIQNDIGEMKLEIKTP